MRPGSLSVIVTLAILAIRCGGADATAPSHPKLDQDYSGAFAGMWQGSATLAMGGLPPQTTTGTQRIDRSAFNRLTVSQMCNGIDGKAGVDSATTFSIEPLTCPPLNQSCGPVTIRYDNGSGKLAGETLTLTLAGNASGCGQNLGFTLSFVGNLLAGTTGGAPDLDGRFEQLRGGIAAALSGRTY